MSLLTPLFLLGLSAVVVPLVLHLIRQVRAQRVVFPSLMHLQRVPEERVRRRRLKDWLLMTLRMALLVLLALAFARPYWQGNVVPLFQPAERTSRVVLLDQSYSMQTAERFAAAQQQALDLIAAADGDELAIVTFDDGAYLQADLTDDADVLTQAVRRATPTFRSTDFFLAMQRAQEVLASARHEDQEVVLVSDFQQSGWSSAFDEWKLAEGVRLETIAVGEAVSENAFVEDANLTKTRQGATTQLRLDARVVQEGDAQPLTLTTQRDGAAQASARVESNASATATIQQVEERSGVYQAELTLGEEAEPWFFTYEVNEQPTVLVVDGSRRSRSSAAFFLQRAFDLGENAPFRYRQVQRGGLNRTATRDAEVIILAGLDNVSSGQQQILLDFVQGGGSLLWSTDVAPTGSTRGLAQALGLGSLGGVADARQAQGYEAIIGEVDGRHPIFRLFETSGTGAIFRAKFRQYVEVAPDSSASVIARYDNNAPLIVEARRGRGHALLFTSSLGTRWTDLPINELYIPLLYQMASYALDDEAVLAYTIGQPVALPGGADWSVRDPDGRVVQVQPDAQGAVWFNATDRPGHYLATSGNERVPFSVNIAPEELRLAARDVEEAYATVVAPTQGEAAGTVQEAALTPADLEERQQFWKWIWLLLIALFLTETVLAHRPYATRST
ncbi:MAG: BatA domain-containing protein [Bacteroidota bacterium]